MIRKLDYIRRLPSLTEYNTLIERVNEIIDKLNKKVEFEPVLITREVKDYKFFNGEEYDLPYLSEHTIVSIEDASEVFKKYALTYKEMNSITKAIEEGKIVSLTVNVTEEVTEKEKKQEAIFETVETIQVAEPKKEKKKKATKKKRKTSRN